MEFNAIRDVVLADLRRLNGLFTTAYQICQRIEAQNPQLWQQLTAAYPSQAGQPAMGYTAGTPYTPATFVAKALAHFASQIPNVQQQYLETDGVEFSRIIPGYPGNIVSIWAWRE